MNMQFELQPPCDLDELNYMMQTFDAILACCTNELGPGATIEMLRDKADLIEAISKRRMH